ncbi:MAG TPA: hypothetical protein VFL62_15985 [Bradyrhizobium sp.]|nr:hypothetical protein [Bradyrhizobium sp.]HET7887724.1 hypothetical protein [Bradyrhizobium sp.]
MAGGKAVALRPRSNPGQLVFIDIIAPRRGAWPADAALFSVGATNLGHLFEKTGVTRQADLVKIVAGFATPFAV